MKLSHKTKIAVVVAIVFTVVGSWVSGCFDSDQTKVRFLLHEMRLGRLPLSATNLGYYSWSGLFTGETYVKIQMSSNDLVTFVKNSPLLAECREEVFTPQHQHLPYDSKQTDSYSDHAHFIAGSKDPSWFELSVTNRGTLYPIWPCHRILVNADSCTVYIHIIKG